MSEQFKGKKEQFTERPKLNIPLLLVLLAATLAIVGVGVALPAFLKPNLVSEEYLGEPVASPRSYVGRVVSMTPIKPVVSEGQIKFPLAIVDKYHIVFFELQNDQGFQVPLMAYITPTGRLFAGSSMCEPCRGRTFSLAGETLVCDTCRTTYTIEGRKFISGAAICGTYPPVDMNPVVKDGMVIIDQQKVLSWRIRAL
ncbi:MAG: DUF2318 domain-containing protein [Syntrophomonadaceae bacterium]|nr:DUF2318 domain-containing protein [Syntrophomonadaceae bacterium]